MVSFGLIARLANEMCLFAVLDQWIYWFGPAVASIMMGILYNLIPPHHTELGKKKSGMVAANPGATASNSIAVMRRI